MSFAGLEDLKPMAGHGGGRPMAGIGPGLPGGFMGVNPMPRNPRPEPTAYMSGSLEELRREVEVLRRERDTYVAAKEKEAAKMRYVGTFGMGQKWGGYYVVINAYDEQSARVTMHEKFGQEWSFLYSSTTNQTAEEAAGVKKWRYKLLTNDMISERTQEVAKPFNVIEGVL